MVMHEELSEVSPYRSIHIGFFFVFCFFPFGLQGLCEENAAFFLPLNSKQERKKNPITVKPDKPAAARVKS